MTIFTKEPLTREEMQALTYYKWRYSLLAAGWWTKQQADHLSFERWRHLMAQQRRVREG